MSHKLTLNFHGPLTSLQLDLLKYIEPIMLQAANIPENLSMTDSVNKYYDSLLKASDVESADAFATAAALLITFYAANQHEVNKPPADRKYKFARVATMLMSPYISLKDDVEKGKQYQELMDVFKDMPMPPTPMHTNAHKANLAKLGYFKSCYNDLHKEASEVRKILNVNYDKPLAEVVNAILGKQSAVSLEQIEELENNLGLLDQDNKVPAARFAAVVARIKEMLAELKGLKENTIDLVDLSNIELRLALRPTSRRKEDRVTRVLARIDDIHADMSKRDVLDKQVYSASNAFARVRNIIDKSKLINHIAGDDTYISIIERHFKPWDEGGEIDNKVDVSIRNAAEAFHKIRDIINKTELVTMNSGNDVYIDIIRARFAAFDAGVALKAHKDALVDQYNEVKGDNSSQDDKMDAVSGANIETLNATVTETYSTKSEPTYSGVRGRILGKDEIDAASLSIVTEPDGTITSYGLKDEPKMMQIDSAWIAPAAPKVPSINLSADEIRAMEQLGIYRKGTADAMLREDEAAKLEGVKATFHIPTDVVAERLGKSRSNLQQATDNVITRIRNMRRNVDALKLDNAEMPKRQENDLNEYAAIHETTHADGTVTRSYITKTPAPESRLEVERDYYKNRCQELEEMLFTEREQNNC